MLGVSGVLAASASAFTVLKLAGAAYLLWLGLQALVAAARGTTFAPDEGARHTPSRGQAFRRGLTSDLVNVKVGLFWTALVPQFLHAGADALMPVAMIVSMGALATGWLTIYALAASRVRQGLRRPAVSRAINATLGAVFVALAGRLAVTSG